MYIAQKLRLGKYLGANVVAWGIVMMLLAVPNTFGPFFFLRLLLGLYRLIYLLKLNWLIGCLSCLRNAGKLRGSDTRSYHIHVL